MKVITGRLSPCVVLAVGIEVLAHELGAVSFDAGHLKSWAHTAEGDGAVDGRGFSTTRLRPLSSLYALRVSVGSTKTVVPKISFKFQVVLGRIQVQSPLKNHLSQITHRVRFENVIERPNQRDDCTASKWKPSARTW